MLPIQFLLIFALVVAFIATWRRVRDGVIRPVGALAWSLVWVVAGIVVALPETTSVIAQFVGVGRGVDLVLYGSVAVLFFLVFRIFIALDRIEREITEVVRRQSLKNINDANQVTDPAASRKP